MDNRPFPQLSLLPLNFLSLLTDISVTRWAVRSMANVDKGNCEDNRELEVLFVHTQHLQWMLSTNKVVFSTRVLTNEKATFRPGGVRPMGGEPESAAVFRTLAQVGADCRRGDCHQQRAAHHRCLGQVSKYSKCNQKSPEQHRTSNRNQCRKHFQERYKRTIKTVTWVTNDMCC